MTNKENSINNSLSIINNKGVKKTSNNFEKNKKVNTETTSKNEKNLKVQNLSDNIVLKYYLFIIIILLF